MARTAVLVMVIAGLTACAARRSELALSTAPAVAPAPAITDPWVMWQGIGARYWGRHTGYQTLEECQAEVQTMAARAEASRRVALQMMETGIAFVPNGAGQATRSVSTSELMRVLVNTLTPRFVCLAQSADPRTPQKDK